MQAPDSIQDVKPTEPGAAASAAGPGGVPSVSPPVSAAAQPPPAAATEDDEEESEDESEILEESPCGRWQKRREEVCKVYNSCQCCRGEFVTFKVDGKIKRNTKTVTHV